MEMRSYRTTVEPNPLGCEYSSKCLGFFLMQCMPYLQGGRLEVVVEEVEGGCTTVSSILSLPFVSCEDFHG